MLVKDLMEEVAENLGDVTMLTVYPHLLQNFINKAARGARAAGWLLPIEPAMVALVGDTWTYDVPANFAYLKELRVGNESMGAGGSEDTGIDVGVGGIDGSSPTLPVTSSSIFAVNDIIKVENEILTVTAIASSTSLTVRRGEFDTTAAAHVAGVAVHRAGTAIEYEYIVPRAYWRLPQITGGQTAAQAARGSRPVVIFNSDYFSFSADEPLQFIGQKRPTVYTAVTETLDVEIEEFLSERSLALAARFLTARGVAGMAGIASQAWANSLQLLSQHPQEFRVKPSSVRVPGR